MLDVLTLAAVTNSVQKTTEASPSAITAIPSMQRVSTASAIFSNFVITLPFYVLNLFFFAYFLLIWALMVRFVEQDCGRRGVMGMRKKNFQVLVLLFNFPGLLLYLMMRPANTLSEIKRAGMEDELLTLELEKLRRESTTATDVANADSKSQPTNTFLS